MKNQSTLKYHKYRILDLDDLIIIKMIGEGCKYKEITKFLNITPPAICHRIRKYERVWDGFSIKNPTKKDLPRICSPQFYEAYHMATKMLEAFNEKTSYGNGSDAELRIAG